MYTNFRFCNSEGQRLAVFAFEEEKNVTTIWILKCSKKDAFSKRRAREIFENWLMYGEAYYVIQKPVRDGNGQVVKIRGGTVLKDDVKEAAHPEIVKLNVPFEQHRVNFYLRALYYRFIPRNYVIEVIKNLYKDALSHGKYIEK